MAEDQRKTELTAELARARSRIGANLGALRHDLDFPAIRIAVAGIRDRAQATAAWHARA